MSELKARIEKRIKERETLGREIQAAVELLAERTHKLIDHDLKSFSMLNKPDALYYDSPVSRIHTYNWIKLYMIKQDLDFVGYFLDGKVAIRTVIDRITEASGWLRRFTDDPVVDKKGLEALL